jgi:hypothetical protein
MNWDWVFPALLFLWIFGAFDYVRAFADAILSRMTGRPQSLSKRKVRKLQRDHTEALDILREIDAYDRFAENPLPTGTHDRLRGYLDSKAGRAPLPTRDERD